MIDRLEFMLSEAWVSLRRNGWMTFAAISTCAVALFLIGGLGYFYLRLNQHANALGSQFEMRVFLAPDLAQAEISEVAKKVREIDGVKAAVWIPKEKAWEKFRDENPEIGADIDNPYPDALKITLTDLAKADSVAASIRALPKVANRNGVQYLAAEQEFFRQVLVLIQWLGIALGSVMMLTSGVLIYNAIKLTIVARRVEIRIMQLVGAARSTIQTPLLIEGASQGAIGGLAAGGLLYLCQLMIAQVVSSMSSIGTYTPLPFWTGALVLMGIGAVYGLVCSYFAVRDPLKTP